ncbi:MAG: hypothetical protein IJX88_02940 [Clostridia bacterium]|nr:hypothetical protein [Clostridia bacterium]
MADTNAMIEFSPYPEIIDKYFQEKQVIIKTIPSELIGINEVEFPNFTVTSAQQYYDYLVSEIEFWKQKDKENHMQEIVNRSRLENAKNNFESALKSYNQNNYGNVKNQLDSSITALATGSLYSKTNLAQFLLQYQMKELNFFNGFKKMLLKERTTTGSWSPAALEGMNVALVYKGVIESSKNLSVEHSSNLERGVLKAYDDFATLNQNYANAFREQEMKIADMRLKAEQYFTEKEKRCAELEKLYDDKLKLSKPAEYWQQMSDSYEKKGKHWLIGSIIMAIATIAMLLCVIIFVPNLFDKDSHLFDIIKNSAIITIIASIAIYIMHLMVKMAMSSYHLARDAKEREQLVGFYLSLIKEKAVTDKERSLIINSLFSRSDTGLLKGDSAPTMTANVADVLDKLK